MSGPEDNLPSRPFPGVGTPIISPASPSSQSTYFDDYWAAFFAGYNVYTGTYEPPFTDYEVVAAAPPVVVAPPSPATPGPLPFPEPDDFPDEQGGRGDGEPLPNPMVPRDPDLPGPPTAPRFPGPPEIYLPGPPAYFPPGPATGELFPETQTPAGDLDSVAHTESPLLGQTLLGFPAPVWGASGPLAWLQQPRAPSPESLESRSIGGLLEQILRRLPRRAPRPRRPIPRRRIPVPPRRPSRPRRPAPRRTLPPETIPPVTIPPNWPPAPRWPPRPQPFPPLPRNPFPRVPKPVFPRRALPVPAPPIEIPRPAAPQPVPLPSPRPASPGPTQPEPRARGPRTVPLPGPRTQPQPFALPFPLPGRRRRLRPLPQPRPRGIPLSPPQPIPQPPPAATPAPGPLPFPFPLPQPPLTPVQPRMVPSSPPGPSSFENQCKRETQQRRNERRAKCVAFIKVPVRAHKKKLCVQDALAYFERKLVRMTRARIRKELEAAGVPLWLLRRRRRPRIPDIEVGGGVEIDVEDIIKGIAQG